MLFSIGYHGLTPPQLIDALQEYEIELLVDVRSRPHGRTVAFNQNAIAPILEANEIKYLWRGKFLGGFSEITDEALEHLIELQEGKNTCIMCLEAIPENCHRFYEIGQRLLLNNAIKIRHIRVKVKKPTECQVHEGRRQISQPPITSIIYNVGKQQNLI